MVWVHINNDGENYLIKYRNGNAVVSTKFSYGSIISTIFTGESDSSLLLYAQVEQIAEYNDAIFTKYRKEIGNVIDDNPYIIEFF